MQLMKCFCHVAFPSGDIVAKYVFEEALLQLVYCLPSYNKAIGRILLNLVKVKLLEGTEIKGFFSFVFQKYFLMDL